MNLVIMMDNNEMNRVLHSYLDKVNDLWRSL